MDQSGTFGQSQGQQDNGGYTEVVSLGQSDSVQGAASNQGPVLPITQGLPQASTQGSCPSSPTGLLPLSQCEGRVSNCWSVGQPDVDCRNNALCCFDGCANVCQGGGSISPAQPPTPSRQKPRPQASQPRPQPSKPRPQSRPKPRPQPPRQPQGTQNTDPWPQTQPARPARPVVQTKPKRPQSRPVTQTQTKPRPWSQSQNQARRPVLPANTEPFVTCPSAMKCVPKSNCDLKGVMTDQVQNYTPQLEALRVPLIPCVNSQRGNTVDVCCRDPNYKDPWPNMMGGGGIGVGGGGAKKGNKQSNNQANKKFSGGGHKKTHSKVNVGGGGHTGNCSSNDDCPPNTPVCSEYGYCQCASYTPGSPDCWMQGGNW